MTTPIHTVLTATRRHGVRSLLMGGQACIVYGAAEFSRDVDLAILADEENLRRLSGALEELRATVTAVPPFAREYLERGHAVHFRCGGAESLRLDVMTRMRNVPPFVACWARRSVYDLDGVGEIDVMGLEDLVACKKTRRDKDWPMVRRLVDVHYLDPELDATEERMRFWLRELRTPSFLVDCARRAPELAREVGGVRDATAAADRVARGQADEAAVTAALTAEEARERTADEAYWRPLLAELEVLRHEARRARRTPEVGDDVGAVERPTTEAST
jgi:hypothetical protein